MPKDLTNINKTVRDQLLEMEVGEMIHYPLRRISSIRQFIYNVSKQNGRNFKTFTDRATNKLNVLRIS